VSIAQKAWNSLNSQYSPTVHLHGNLGSTQRGETVQASSKVTIEREFEVTCDLSKGIISNVTN